MFSSRENIYDTNRRGQLCETYPPIPCVRYNSYFSKSLGVLPTQSSKTLRKRILSSIKARGAFSSCGGRNVVERFYMSQFSTQRSFSKSTSSTTDLIKNATIRESIVLFKKDIFQRIFQIWSCSIDRLFYSRYLPLSRSHKRWPVGLVV